MKIRFCLLVDRWMSDRDRDTERLHLKKYKYISNRIIDYNNNIIDRIYSVCNAKDWLILNTSILPRVKE